tara:strand:- start:361 stop:714 length:354 start_codon:yes stop_codon:yes gene_type:complete
MSEAFTEEEKRGVFLRAVHSYSGSKERWEKRSENPMSDEELQEALKYELGTFGGGGCRDSISIAYQGCGLKIWADRDYANFCLDEPFLQGLQTIKMARLVFNIIDAANPQTDLFGGL